MLVLSLTRGDIDAMHEPSSDRCSSDGGASGRALQQTPSCYKHFRLWATKYMASSRGKETLDSWLIGIWGLESM